MRVNIIDVDVLAHYTQQCIHESLDASERDDADGEWLRSVLHPRNTIALTSLVEVMNYQGGRETHLQNAAAEWVGAQIGQLLYDDNPELIDPLRQAAKLTTALVQVLDVYPPGNLLPPTAREEWASEANLWRETVHRTGLPYDVVARHNVTYDAEDTMVARWWVVNVFNKKAQESDVELVRDALNHVRPGWDVESRYGRIEATSSNLV